MGSDTMEPGFDRQGIKGAMQIRYRKSDIFTSGGDGVPSRSEVSLIVSLKARDMATDQSGTQYLMRYLRPEILSVEHEILAVEIPQIPFISTVHFQVSDAAGSPP